MITLRAAVLTAGTVAVAVAFTRFPLTTAVVVTFLGTRERLKDEQRARLAPASDIP